MSKRTRKLLASDIAMIDPADCGSTVGYAITRTRHGLSAEVELSDCNRKINWYFADSADAVIKIVRAIILLKEFHAEFVKARASTGKKRRDA